MLDIGERFYENLWIRKAADWHESMNCCCLLFNARNGFRIIFLGLLISLAEEYFAFNNVRFVIKLAVIAPFILTLIQDIKFYRWLCMYMYCAGMPLIFLCNFFMYGNILVSNVLFADQLCWINKKWVEEFGGTKSQNEAIEECNEADEEDQASCEANLDQCPVLPGGAAKTLFVITPLIIVVNLHFAFVLYTHTQNADRG